jgi:hypothetical protein
MEEETNLFKEMFGALDDLESQLNDLVGEKKPTDVKEAFAPADLNLNTEEDLAKLLSSVIQCENDQEEYTSFEDRENKFLLQFIEKLLEDFPDDKKDLVRQEAIKVMHKTTF